MEQLSLESGDTTAEVGAAVSRLEFPPTQERPGVPAGPGPSLLGNTNKAPGLQSGSQ